MRANEGCRSGEYDSTEESMPSWWGFRRGLVRAELPMQKPSDQNPEPI